MSRRLEQDAAHYIYCPDSPMAYTIVILIPVSSRSFNRTQSINQRQKRMSKIDLVCFLGAKLNLLSQSIE